MFLYNMEILRNFIGQAFTSFFRCNLSTSNILRTLTGPECTKLLSKLPSLPGLFIPVTVLFTLVRQAIDDFEFEECFLFKSEVYYSLWQCHIVLLLTGAPRWKSILSHLRTWWLVSDISSFLRYVDCFQELQWWKSFSKPLASQQRQLKRLRKRKLWIMTALVIQEKKRLNYNSVPAATTAAAIWWEFESGWHLFL